LDGAGAAAGAGGNSLSVPVGSGGSVLAEETPAGAGGGGTIRAELSAAGVDGIDELPDRLRTIGGGGGGMPMPPLSESDDPVPKASVVRVEPVKEAFDWGLTSGACVESDMAGSEADVCWMAVSVIGFEPQLELTGVPPVLTAGGFTFFMLSTPPVGTTDPPVAEPAGIGAIAPLEFDGAVVAGAMVAGVLFHACDAPVVPVGLVAAAVACAPDCDGLLTKLRMFPD
jgi:hypothetical protein